MKKIALLLFIFLYLFGRSQAPTYIPNADQYGAVHDGVTNDSAALQNLINANSGEAVYIGPGTYMANGLVIPEKTIIYGYQATIKKNRNGAIATIGNRVEIYGLKFHGNAPTYSGLGLIITEGNDQKLYGVEILYDDSFNLAISKDVGIRFAWIGGQSIRYGSITNPSIKLGHGGASQESNGDRLFSGIYAGGTWLIDAQYSQTTIISNCNFVNMKFGANASKTLVTGCRIATLGNELEIDGSQCNISGNIIAGGITIKPGATYNVIGYNTMAVDETVTDNSGNATNKIAP